MTDLGEAGPAPAATERAFSVRPARAGLEALSVAVVAWAWAAILYRIWNASARVPIYQDRADARLISNLVKNTITQGWFETNPHLGAPFGQELYDFPHGGETWQLTIIKGMSLFIKDPGLLVNVYFLAGFGTTAAVTFLVLRHLRFSYPVAAVAGLLYAFLPFHFYHEQSHLFRSSYWYAPIACLVLVWAMQWRERFLRDPDPPTHGGRWSSLRWNLAHNLRRRRVVVILLLCVLLGGTETMTTCFTMTLLAVTGIIGALRHREPARLLVSGLLVAVVGVTFLALLYPTLHYVHQNGTNDVAARRTATDQERFGLKISSMVLPTQDHRNRRIGMWSYKAQAGSSVPSEGGQALTTLGGVGFFTSLWWLITRGWGRLPAGMRRDRRSPSEREALLDDASLLILASTLIGTIAGLAMVLSVIGFSQVRVWNRIVLIIAFFAFAFTGHWFERLADRLRGWLVHPGPVLLALTLVVGTFGLWDDGKPAERDYPALKADYLSDKSFVADIERSVPKGTNVFQLPVVPFPESAPPGKMLDYDQLRPFLVSDGTTNWSYGKVKGRPQADWQLPIGTVLDPVDVLPALLGMGYTGLWVDTFGYLDGGARLRAQLTRTIGRPPMEAPNHRQLYFDLRAYKQRLGQSDAALRALARRTFHIAPPPLN